jgi:N-acetylmuramoyl-L-alanine amidase
MRTINAIIVHHSVSPRETTTFNQINGWHKDKGFFKSRLGFFIGYHYVIGANWIKQARLVEEIGAHAKGWNEDTIGICLTGNFETEFPNKYQLKELGKLLVGLMADHGLKESDIKLHKEVSQTACPGRNLQREIVLGTLRHGNGLNQPPAETEMLDKFLAELQTLINKYKK